MAAFKLMRFLLPKAEREHLLELEEEYRRITDAVDSFYAILGPRNWVFHGDLNLSKIERVIETEDSSEAERRLIDYYREAGCIEASVRRLCRFEGMRPRRGLLNKALTDYNEGRYYSTVLVLLAVMDGFVNDFEKESRKGLHTRPAEDMVAWDSVAGHHLGLSHAHRSFLKGFYKTDESEVVELYRNGIMHGVLVNFDNEMVSTKAWNRLFAVADWAEARTKQAAPVEAEPSLRETFAKIRSVQEENRRLSEWQPHEHDVSPDGGSSSEVAGVCGDFLERWQKRQWGLLGGHFLTFGSGKPSVGEQARVAKDLYSPHELGAYTLLKVRHVAAAVAQVDVMLVVDGVSRQVSLRWVRTGEEGQTASEWVEGTWKLAPYGPSVFLA